MAFSDIITLQRQFDDNKAEYGGVLRSFTSTVAVNDGQFTANNATFGGVILSFNSSLTMNKSKFTNNKADVYSWRSVSCCSYYCHVPGITSYIV